MDSIIFPALKKNYTQQIVGIVNAKYLRNGSTQIHKIFRNFLAHTPAQNLGKIAVNFEGVVGGRPHQKIK